MFHETKDKRVLKFCKTLGFRLQELPEEEPVTLAQDFKLICGRQGLLDSWLAVFAEGKTVLNMNDCLYERKRELAAIRGKVGKVDLLLSQFSYANWVGNPGDHLSHREHAYRKGVELSMQIRHLQPAMFVPFASFIYFSHAENFYMNGAVNSIRNIYQLTSHQLKVPTVVLYPGDRWQVGAPRDSSESIRRYEVDSERAMAASPETTPSASLAQLQLAADVVGFAPLLLDQRLGRGVSGY